MRTALLVAEGECGVDFSDALTGAGYAVMSAESASKAFRCIEEFEIDAVVLTRFLSAWTRRAISEFARTKRPEIQVICIGACDVKHCCGRGWISEEEPHAVLAYLGGKIDA